MRDTHAAFALVEAGLGITLMNDIYARDTRSAIAFMPLAPRTDIEIGVATPASALSPALAALRRLRPPAPLRPKPGSGREVRVWNTDGKRRPFPICRVLVVVRVGSLRYHVGHGKVSFP